MDVYKMIYDLVRQIPEGFVTTYGAIARALGDIRASRAVGEVLSINPTPIVVPCHRVIMSDGSLGGYTHPEGIKRKMELLRKEGVEIVGGKVDLKKYFFDDFKIDIRPFELFRKYQEEIAKKISLEDHGFDRIVGVDLSYDGRYGIAAIVVFENPRKPEFVRYYSRMTLVPYVPTYLAFREYPIIEAVSKDLKGCLFFLDGHGILHPRKCGYASHVGVELDTPSIGVAKSFLVGEIVRESKNMAKVLIDGEIRGYAIYNKNKPSIYISPGHKISIPSSLKMTLEAKKYKIPEPTRLAHYHSKLARDMFRKGRLIPEKPIEINL
ncbi:MAG: endonuclease V [Thermoplasmata archaeon]|nr:MAG: endonuclease V [Thermoplasmata archaeon]